MFQNPFTHMLIHLLTRSPGLQMRCLPLPSLLNLPNLPNLPKQPKLNLLLLPANPPQMTSQSHLPQGAHLLAKATKVVIPTLDYI
jgi:hypothetical protein